MSAKELCDQSTGDADNRADSRTMGGQGIYPNERATVLALAEAWNLFMRLDGRDYEMERDFRQSINRAQDIIAFRVASRVNPDLWRPLPTSSKPDEVLPPETAKPQTVEECAFTWKCSACGTVNGIHRDACPDCGMSIYKSQAESTPLRAYTSWGMSPVEKTAAEQEADEALAAVKDSTQNAKSAGTDASEKTL